MSRPELAQQFSDHFSRDYGPPDYFDMTHWAKWKGDAKTENGYGVLYTTAEPGELSFSGIGTRQLRFNPGLKGTNGLEVTLVDHVPAAGEPVIPAPPEEDGSKRRIRFFTGFSVLISSFYGQIGGEADRSIHRGVQVCFDWIKPWGLDWAVVRTILPEDYEDYAVWDIREDTLLDYMKMGKHVSPPVFALAMSHYEPDEMESPFGHRVGLYLTDDANTVHWTLDGVVRDTIDITGYFASYAPCVENGAYVTISGVGHPPHSWTADDVAIYASR